MTEKDYLDKSRNFHMRLKILRQQIDEHMKGAHPRVSNDSINGLVHRMCELCDELTALDKEFWGDA